MPADVQFDGPRDLRNLVDPAIGTFAVGYGWGDGRRYDAIVLDHIQTGDASDAEVLEDVVLHLDGDPSMVVPGRMREVDGRAEIDYVEDFDGRRYEAHAYGLGDVVVIVNAAVRYGSDEQETTLAREHLEEMKDAVVLPGPEDATVPCEPSIRPIDR